VTEKTSLDHFLYACGVGLIIKFEPRVPAFIA